MHKVGCSHFRRLVVGFCVMQQDVFSAHNTFQGVQQVRVVEKMREDRAVVLKVVDGVHLKIKVIMIKAESNLVFSRRSFSYFMFR